MKILLTGITGFIGSYLTQELVKKHHQVVGVSRSNLNTTKIQPILACDNFQLVQADLSESFTLPDNVDIIIHTAAQLPVRGVSVDEYIKNSVIATRNLVKYACQVGVTKFIYTSSISIYGEIEAKVVDEETPIINPSPYGITKYICELLLHDSRNSFPSVALRLPGVLGKGAHSHWLVNVVKRALEGKDISIYNPDAYFNNTVYLQDMQDIIERIVNQNIEGFNAVTLGCAQPLSIKETVSFLIEQLKSNSEIVEEKSNRVSFAISIEKAKRLFGYNPLPLRDILRKYVSEL